MNSPPKLLKTNRLAMKMVITEAETSSLWFNAYLIAGLNILWNQSIILSEKLGLWSVFLLRNNDESELSDILLFSDLKVSLKAKEAKELIQEVEEFNEGLTNQYLHDCELCKGTEQVVKSPELRTIEFKGLKLKYNYYPRFS